MWCLVVLMDVLLTEKKKTEGKLFLKTWFKQSHFILFMLFYFKEVTGKLSHMIGKGDIQYRASNVLVNRMLTEA